MLILTAGHRLESHLMKKFDEMNIEILETKYFTFSRNPVGAKIKVTFNYNDNGQKIMKEAEETENRCTFSNDTLEVDFYMMNETLKQWQRDEINSKRTIR